MNPTALFALVLALAPVMPALGEVPIRHSPALQGEAGDGTKGYEPLPDEKPIREKITEKKLLLWEDIKMPQPANLSVEEWAAIQREEAERKKDLIPVGEYELAKQAGEFVGWCGIARAREFDAGENATRLTVEHKYFDGLTDLRLHIVSHYGAGDFEVVLPGDVDATAIPELALICAYGRVSLTGDKPVLARPEYIRVWDWGRFSFMDYGLDKSNPEWVKLRKVTGPQVYSPNPDQAFYEDRVGQR